MSTFIKLVFTNVLVISIGWATTYQPVSIEKMVTGADAILMGDYLKSQTIKTEDGLVATEAIFRIEREMGIDAEEFGLSEIKVYYPGGDSGQSGVRIDGAPSFVPGEKSVLLLSQHTDGRLWIQSMALGTFKVLKIGSKTFLMNSVFPGNPELSHIEISEFIKKVGIYKDEPFKEVYTDKYTIQYKNRKNQKRDLSRGKSRSIASQSNQIETTSEPNIMNSFWLLLILGLMGVLKKWWSRENTK
jgi:hypothetical protein